MFELQKAGERTYYIDCPAKIGIFLADEKNVFLIDSGSDKDAGRRVKKILDEHGWAAQGIINTHSNSDHIGGNAYLQRQFGCKVFAHGIEKSFTEYPILESSFLYGGFPCEDLRHKFLLAEESTAVDFSDDVFPKELEIIPLPGHFFDMTGFRTPDNVVFLADCLSSEKTLDKYRIGFIYDIKRYLETLESVKQLKARLFIPSHAAACEDITALADYNIVNVNENAAEILEICAEPLCFEQILQRLFTEFKLKMNFEQYVLVGSTVRSYLAWLKDSGRLSAEFKDNMLLWKANN